MNHDESRLLDVRNFNDHHTGGMSQAGRPGRGHAGRDRGLPNPHDRALEVIIVQDTGFALTLTPAGPNKYTGSRQVPGESMQLPVTVTVEEKQIVIETRGGGLTSRQIINARGLAKDDIW